MRGILTDEHISHVVAQQIRAARPDIFIESLLIWKDGALKNRPDEEVLTAAREHGLVLLTFDQRTIPTILAQWAINGQSRQGVVFASQRTISTFDIGGLVRAITRLYDEYGDADWTDRVQFLAPEPI